MMVVSFRARVFAAIALVLVVALGCACGLFLGMRYMEHRTGIVRDMELQSNILEHNAAASLLFVDVQGATSLLQGLQADERLLHAVLYDEGGEAIAQYVRREGLTVPPVAPEEGVRRQNGQISVVTPIQFEGETIGWLALTADGAVVAARMRSLFAVTALVFFGTLGFGFLIGSRLSAALVGPIRELSGALTQVGEQGNYSVRVPIQRDDEIGDLVRAANDMLCEIELRDQELLDGRRRLEERVRQRTRDLARAKEAAELSAGSLRVSEERFRSLSTAAPLGIFQLDVAGRFVYTNPRLLEMFDQARASIMGFGWIRHLDRADQRWVRTRMASRDDAGWTREFAIETGEEGTRWLHFAASPADAAGNRAGTVADVTERRRAEVEREALNMQLREASRRAGMAEVATGVLHNVGNVLNSVNVSATFLHDHLKRSKVDAVARLSALIDEQEDFVQFVSHDKRGAVLPAYLVKLAESLQSEREELMREIDGLRSHVDHIKQIVVMQQSLARAGGVTELCSLSDMVEEALSIDAESFRNHGIGVERDFAQAPDVVLDRHKLLQILINLVTNAKHAMKEGSGERVLRVRIGWDDADGAVIDIQDSGIGISPENLDRVFNHGFTSRSDGHGFGLHSSAIAAKEMGGSLNGYSDGPGCGARFTVRLPASVRADQSVEMSA